jgi:hypothetical protein
VGGAWGWDEEERKTLTQRERRRRRRENGELGGKTGWLCGEEDPPFKTKGGAPRENPGPRFKVRTWGTRHPEKNSRPRFRYRTRGTPDWKVNGLVGIRLGALGDHGVCAGGAWGCWG